VSTAGRAAAVVCAAAAFTGCGSVLTQSQVDAVHAFSDAATPYPDVPKAAVEAYAGLHVASSMLSAATALPTDAALGLNRLEKTLVHNADARAKAKELATGLDVLRQYASGLGKLSSDAVLASLDTAAASVGTAIDGSIDAYNTIAKPPTNVPTFGSNAAALVRAAGGLVVRHQQAVYLRRFVADGAPVFKRVVDSTRDLLLELYNPSSRAGLLVVEKDALEHDYLTYANLRAANFSASDVALFASALRDEIADEELVASALRATDAAEIAHAELAASLSPEACTCRTMETINALLKEVQAGLRLRK
jgi:hypothetical protein